MEIIDAITPPPIKAETRKLTDFLSWAMFPIIKNSNPAKTRGITAISESKRFIEKIAEKTALATNRIIAKSKGVLLNLTELVAIVFVPHKIKEMHAATPTIICLGRTKASVVKVVKITGRARKSMPNKNKETLSMYDINSFLFSILF